MITPLMEVAELTSIPGDGNNRRGRKSQKVYGHTLPRQSGPSMSALDAVNYIQAKGEEVSRQWLLKQAREKGPEGNDGILGWVHIPFSSSETEGGWYPRHLYDAAQTERLAVWFDIDELDRWIDARKISLANTLEREKALEDIDIPSEVRERIIRHMPLAKDEQGGVNRTKLRDILMKEYGYSERYIYKRIQKVAKEEQWGYTAAMPRRPRFNLKTKAD